MWWAYRAKKRFFVTKNDYEDTKGLIFFKRVFPGFHRDPGPVSVPTLFKTTYLSSLIS